MVATTYPQLPNDVRVVSFSPSELPSYPRISLRLSLTQVQHTRMTNMNYTGFFRSPQVNRTICNLICCISAKCNARRCGDNNCECNATRTRNEEATSKAYWC